MRTLTLIRKTVSPADPPVTLRVVTHSGAGGLLPVGEERALPIREQGEEVSFFLPDGKAPGCDSRIAIPAGRGEQIYNLATGSASLALAMLTLPDSAARQEMRPGASALTVACFSPCREIGS